MIDYINLKDINNCNFYIKDNKQYLVVSPTQFFQGILLGD